MFFKADFFSFNKNVNFLLQQSITNRSSVRSLGTITNGSQEKHTSISKAPKFKLKPILLNKANHQNSKCIIGRSTYKVKRLLYYYLLTTLTDLEVSGHDFRCSQNRVNPRTRHSSSLCSQTHVKIFRVAGKVTCKCKQHYYKTRKRSIISASKIYYCLLKKIKSAEVVICLEHKVGGFHWHF